MAGMSAGKIIMIIGAVLVAAGGAMVLLERGGIQLFRLPGDIVVQRKNFTVYFPLATCVVLSIVLTLVFWFIGRGGR
jgi:hypothetical protein